MKGLTSRCGMNVLLRAFMIGLALACSSALAEGIGVMKVVSGDVRVERAGQVVNGVVGMRVNESDRVITGRNGSVGLSFDDASMLSAGPNSTLTLDRFKFDPATQDGNFDVGLRNGTLSVISGKLIQKTPGSMRVKTPAAVLAVRGTEFVVQVEQ